MVRVVRVVIADDIGDKYVETRPFDSFASP